MFQPRRIAVMMISQTTLVALCVVTFMMVAFVESSNYHVHEKLVKRAVINDTICDEVTNKKTLRMKAVLMFSNRLYIISKDWMIYTFETSLKNISHGLDLRNISYVPIEQKWPAFNNNKRFNEIKNKITLIYSAELNITKNASIVSCVVMNVPTTSADTKAQGGIKYFIEEDKLTDGFTYNVTEQRSEYVAPITSNQRFFTVEYGRHFGDNLNLIQWTEYESNEKDFKFNSSEKDAQPMLYSSSNNTVMLQQKNTSLPSGYTPIQGSNWQIVNGFIRDGIFYLFSSKAIYKFSWVILNNIQSKVDIVDLSKFFICQDQIIYTKRPTTTQHNTTAPEDNKLWLIILAVVVALIIIGTVIIISYLTKGKPNKHQKGKSSQHSSHKNKHSRRGSSANKMSDVKQKKSNSKPKIDRLSQSKVASVEKGFSETN